MKPTTISTTEKEVRIAQHQLAQALKVGKLHGDGLLAVSEFVWGLLGEDTQAPTKILIETSQDAPDVPSDWWFAHGWRCVMTEAPPVGGRIDALNFIGLSKDAVVYVNDVFDGVQIIGMSQYWRPHHDAPRTTYHRKAYAVSRGVVRLPKEHA